ncbi:Diaminopimelate epimerase [Croceitalea dokdonensis DOKDO 023]|uniref:Diaminopimelate epimerase n=1 Tax=Croceitalea dokdonensis DOKDO 023 TaxID=1300341 RepID=A0A0N8H4L4_9FLAO|nr:diaminopimelate epimerase [Croceitalea dokdonensis]KPM33700.1 Diaminopimelate epimerase [Croceitalea dokdonensis DOKDO 023]
MDDTKTIPFYKYQGTGNDFILVDNRHLQFPKNDTKYIRFLCDRKFGIGADGFILLENDKLSDFKMVYYNADGNQSSMCGNGGRCIVAFANQLGIVKDKACFNAIDGLHRATIKDKVVSLDMMEVKEVTQRAKAYFLNTGSPHHVQLVDSLTDFNVVKEGAKLRYGLYGEVGSNINFVAPVEGNRFSVRTYERGVEDETLSCGTGVTAVALAMFHAEMAKTNIIEIETPGGELTVSFDHDLEGFKNIVLSGPATFVFQGEIAV